MPLTDPPGTVSARAMSNARTENAAPARSPSPRRRASRGAMVGGRWRALATGIVALDLGQNGQDHGTGTGLLVEELAHRFLDLRDDEAKFHRGGFTVVQDLDDPVAGQRHQVAFTVGTL